MSAFIFSTQKDRTCFLNTLPVIKQPRQATCQLTSSQHFLGCKIFCFGEDLSNHGKCAFNMTKILGSYFPTLTPPPFACLVLKILPHRWFTSIATEKWDCTIPSQFCCIGNVHGLLFLPAMCWAPLKGQWETEESWQCSKKPFPFLSVSLPSTHLLALPSLLPHLYIHPHSWLYFPGTGKAIVPCNQLYCRGKSCMWVSEQAREELARWEGNSSRLWAAVRPLECSMSPAVAPRELPRWGKKGEQSLDRNERSTKLVEWNRIDNEGSQASGKEVRTEGASCLLRLHFTNHLP